MINKHLGHLGRFRRILTRRMGRLRRLIRQLRRLGRSQMEVNAFRSRQVVVTINADQHRHKIFQILFGKDGSLYVTFPYFAHTMGILAEVTVTGPPGSSSNVDLADKGRVASHLAKYSHHPDGKAHFSQDGKIRTEIRRQSVDLDDQQGHIFTILIQGLRAFTPVASTKENKTSARRTTLTFDVLDRFPKAFRIVGRWYWLEDLHFEPRPPVTGPVVQVADPDGDARNAFIVASPDEGTKHVLLLTCTPQDAISAQQNVLMFYGGFDPPARTLNSSKPTRFLAFLYPADDFEELKRRLASIDFMPPVPVIQDPARP
jgi:hypothetical protein